MFLWGVFNATKFHRQYSFLTNFTKKPNCIVKILSNVNVHIMAVLMITHYWYYVCISGIVRKRKRLCLNYKSTDSLDNKVSIHDFLASKSVEKTLEDILTEGNPNYRWYSHRLLKGTIVEIDKSQIQINTWVISTITSPFFVKNISYWKKIPTGIFFISLLLFFFCF